MSDEKRMGVLEHLDELRSRLIIALIAILVAVSAVHTWDVLPTLRRALMRKDRIPKEELDRLQRRERWLMRWSLILAALILLATGFARAS